MAIKSLSDLNAAFDAGRFHAQRFYKNAGAAHALAFADSSYASGQPPYDARVGTSGSFTPTIAQKNDAVFFPAIAAGMQRVLVESTWRVSQNTFNGPSSVVLFDLVGYYPLIDGDNTDEQLLDNTEPLPRYADGKGVIAVIVNHVSPALLDGVAIVNFTDSDDVDHVRTVRVDNNGINCVCSGSNATNASAGGNLNWCHGGNGVKRVNSITYTTPPSGLHAVYMLKVLDVITTGDNNLAYEKQHLQMGGFRPIIIPDGAWLNWFDRIGSGTTRQTSYFGNFLFAWG